MTKALDLVRIVQVSDTHISRKRAYFFDNWEVFVDEMRRQPPDLIVHSGDAQEHQQALFLERSLQERSGRPVMLFHVGAWNAANGSSTKMPPRPLVRS